MSDALSAFSSLSSRVPGLSGITSLIASQLSIASWRGVPFYLLTDDSEVGQRVVRFLFPGRAGADFQWLGPDDGDIRIDGLLIGTDCVRQANKMKAACRLSGKGRLVHPWYGSFDAVLTEKAHFGVSEREFGLVHFSATFQRWTPPAPAAADWFGKLQDAVDRLMDQARGLLADVFGVLAAPLAAYAFVSGLLATAAGLWGALGLGAAAGVGVGGSAAQAAVADAAADLADAAPVPDATYADTVASLLAAPALALAEASQPQGAAAIGPGPVADASVAFVDPADAAAALLAVAAGLAAPSSAAPDLQAIALAAQMTVVAQAAAVGATVDFTAMPDAQAWGATIDAAIGGIQAQAAQLSTALPLSAGAAWRALGVLRTAAAADVASRLVDLPALLTVTTDRTQDAWRVALSLCGDTPEAMTAAVVDLWRRNIDALPMGNPALVPPGTYAVLAA